jgi:diaminohydroxyphosphoribosylaminopyrimidine deaminase/5-amino-6-(5-phosphoribosylamino)uracil reductase
MYENDVKYMSAALSEAEKAGPEVYPNPKVGAIIVFNGEIISRGHTQEYGGDHAEVVAIKNLNKKYKNCTLFVTLEPCTHKGKTGACTDLINSEIFERVVIANSEINPKASGGAKLLSEKGISITEGVCSQNAKKINKRFFTFYEKKRPYVILKIASTLNGFIAEKDGQSKWITNEKSRSSGYLMRANCDAIMVGTNTVINDDPSLTSHGLGKKDPKIILIDLEKKLNHKANVFKHNPIVFSNDILGLNHAKNIEIILKKLFDMSFQSLFVEGGGKTLSHFIDTNLFDELHIYYAPKLTAGGKPLYDGLKKINDKLELHLDKIEQIDNDIKIKYLKKEHVYRNN